MSKPVRRRYSVPKGPVLGPKFYTMYTKPVGLICKKKMDYIIISMQMTHNFIFPSNQLMTSPKQKHYVVSKCA